jgi:hypothetical protein
MLKKVDKMELKPSRKSDPMKQQEARYWYWHSAQSRGRNGW